MKKMKLNFQQNQCKIKSMKIKSMTR